MERTKLSELYVELDKLKSQRNYIQEQEYPTTEEDIKPNLEPEPDLPVYPKPTVSIFGGTKKVNIGLGVVAGLIVLFEGAMAMIVIPCAALFVAPFYGGYLYWNYQRRLTRYQMVGEYAEYKASLDAQYEAELLAVRARNEAKLKEYEGVREQYRAAYKTWLANKEAKLASYDEKIAEVEAAIKLANSSEVQ